MKNEKLLNEIVREIKYLSSKGVSDKEIDRALNEALSDFGIGGISDLTSGLWSGIKDIPNKVTDFSSNIKDNVTGTFDKVKSIGGSIGTGVIETFKKRVAKYIVAQLNIQPDTFMALVIINFFVNLDIKDYKKVFKDCEFTSSLMAESLIDALIEQMRIKMEFDNLTYSIIQDTVMDQMKKNETVQNISDKLNGYICPHLADARKMILGKAPWASSFI
jgi:hypothetical protein